LPEEYLIIIVFNVRHYFLDNKFAWHLFGAAQNRLTSSRSNSHAQSSTTDLARGFLIHKRRQNLRRGSLYPLQRLHECFPVTVVQLYMVTAAVGIQTYAVTNDKSYGLSLGLPYLFISWHVVLSEHLVRR
jgi:hypothetical protein